MKKQKENSLENITWSEMGKQNVQAKEVYFLRAKLMLLENINDNPTYGANKIFTISFLCSLQLSLIFFSRFTSIIQVKLSQRNCQHICTAWVLPFARLLKNTSAVTLAAFRSKRFLWRLAKFQPQQLMQEI